MDLGWHICPWTHIGRNNCAWILSNYFYLLGCHQQQDLMVWTDENCIFLVNNRCSEPPLGLYTPMWDSSSDLSIVLYETSVQMNIGLMFSSWFMEFNYFACADTTKHSKFMIWRAFHIKKNYGSKFPGRMISFIDLSKLIWDLPLDLWRGAFETG